MTRSVFALSLRNCTQDLKQVNTLSAADETLLDLYARRGR